MHLLRVLLVDGDDKHRCRMKALLEARRVECWDLPDIASVQWPLSLKGIDLVVAELGAAAGCGGPSLDTLLRKDNHPRPPPVIIYVDPLQQSASWQITRAPVGAILIPAPVLEADLDSALDRAFTPWGQAAN